MFNAFTTMHKTHHIWAPSGMHSYLLCCKYTLRSQKSSPPGDDCQLALLSESISILRAATTFNPKENSSCIVIPDNT